MMGYNNSQLALYCSISLEDFVPQDHPLRAIRPLIDAKEIRKIFRDLYAPIGRPSIPPEQLFIALVAGYLLGITCERKLVMDRAENAFRHDETPAAGPVERHPALR